MEPAILKIILLISFVMFIPISAACYYFSRSDQRHSEIGRYMNILDIKDKELFEQKNQALTLFIAVFFVTFLSLCFWSLILFGSDIKLTSDYNYLFGSTKIVDPGLSDNTNIENYQNGAMLTFNMAFLGAYLWGIQSITRRYSMNDLIPVAYYNLGVRMIFASVLAIIIYHLVEVTPDIFASLPGDDKTEIAGTTQGSQMVMPVFAFLIGMFPKRALNWLTDKFAAFSQKGHPSVRDLPLEMIEGVTIYDRVRLQELGIDCCYDLANADYVPCLFKTPYSPRVLINWILQAKLCVYFGDHVKDLREHGIHTVWQLNNYEIKELKELVKSSALTEEMLVMVKNLISKDGEIERLVAAQIKLSRYWSQEDLFEADPNIGIADRKETP